MEDGRLEFEPARKPHWSRTSGRKMNSIRPPRIWLAEAARRGRLCVSSVATLALTIVLFAGAGLATDGTVSKADTTVTNSPAVIAAGSNSPASAETVRTYLSKWVEAEQMAARERRDAQQNRDILTARIDILKEGITGMNEKMSQAEEKLKLAQKQKTEVADQIEQNTTAITQLTTDVTDLEARIHALQPRLPTPLKDKIKTLYERMPASGSTNAVRVSLAERCQNVLGILNEINKFNSEISTVFDVRSLSDGKPSEVTCVYAGLGQAFSVSPLGVAAVGRPTMGTQGWNWVATPASAEAIALTLKILQNKAKPAFVPLPIELNIPEPSK